MVCLVSSLIKQITASLFFVVLFFCSCIWLVTQRLSYMSIYVDRRSGAVINIIFSSIHLRTYGRAHYSQMNKTSHNGHKFQEMTMNCAHSRTHTCGYMSRDRWTLAITSLRKVQFMAQFMAEWFFCSCCCCCAQFDRTHSIPSLTIFMSWCRKMRASMCRERAQNTTEQIYRFSRTVEMI